MNLSERSHNKRYAAQLANTYRSPWATEKANNRKAFFKAKRDARKDQWAHTSQFGTGGWSPKTWDQIRGERKYA